MQREHEKFIISFFTLTIYTEWSERGSFIIWTRAKKEARDKSKRKWNKNSLFTHSQFFFVRGNIKWHQRSFLFALTDNGASVVMMQRLVLVCYLGICRKSFNNSYFMHMEIYDGEVEFFFSRTKFVENVTLKNICWHFR
jgi:hypothetical protein